MLTNSALDYKLRDEHRQLRYKLMAKHRPDLQQSILDNVGVRYSVMDDSSSWLPALSNPCEPMHLCFLGGSSDTVKPLVN
jgi:hypothetical protein